ncbi:MAG: glycosyltransferase family 4 protein [Bacteroidota bacterium]
MKILFLTDNFPPESNAPASRTYEHCIEWLKKGAEVTVITCAPNYPKGKVYPGYKNKLYQTEMMDGIKVIRVWTYVTPNRGLFRRSLDYLSFCISAFFASLFVRTDIIIATSPQLFAALGGWLSAFCKRKPWIMEIRDLWPESIKAVEAVNESRILNWLDKLVLFLYRRATRIVVVTDSFKRSLIADGIDAAKIEIVKNGVQMSKYQKRPKSEQLVQRLGLQNKFVVAYIGTHGMAHKLDFIVDCAAEVDDPAIHFLFLGEGAMKGRLKRKVAQLQLANITILDAVSKQEVPEYIALSDVALVPLRKKDTFKTVIPSKIFENAAMARPILLGVDGEARQIIEFYKAGLYFEPEDKASFLQQLHTIKNNKEVYEQCQQGTQHLAQAFDRQALALKMYGYIEDIVLRGWPVSENQDSVVKVEKKAL